MRSALRRLAMASSICLLAATTCAAQSTLASISGVVTDPQSAMVPQARITATNTGTGVATAAGSNSAGFYSLRNLPIGLYDLSVEHTGFHTYIRRGVRLSTGEQLGLDIRLELGATEQAVTVT